MGGMLAARTKKRCTPDRLSLPQIYMRQRWYDPQLQRFISRDPIGFGGGENFYAYASNRPLDMVDPGGSTPAAVLVAGAAGGTLAAGALAVGATFAVFGASVYITQAINGTLPPSVAQDEEDRMREEAFYAASGYHSWAMPPGDLYGHVVMSSKDGVFKPIVDAWLKVKLKINKWRRVEYCEWMRGNCREKCIDYKQGGCDWDGHEHEDPECDEVCDKAYKTCLETGTFPDMDWTKLLKWH